ncbi:MAG: hypothetical protein A2Z96_07005 [Spirochaetes bacterium GWB1_48_6]|nr:MAG: hypothetical protein A2Z96_07005 [Spirochaetes bacterium GWB1_48_6]
MANYTKEFSKIIPKLRQKDHHFPLQGDTWNKSSWDDSSVKVLVVRLSPFRDVIFSMTHGFLAREALAFGAYVDFSFLPVKQDRDLLKQEGIPLLLGAFSYRDWRDFDLVFLSNAYTLEMLNLLPLFKASGVPLKSSDRSLNHPLFILGGANALATQSFLIPQGDGAYDSFLDGIFFGEGEGQVSNLVDLVYSSKGTSRTERLDFLSEKIPGLWTPGKPKIVSKALCQSRGEDLLTVYPILNSEEATTARLQISYGCPYFCSFCFEGYDRKPYREVTMDEILKAAKDIKIKTGARNIDLYSFNFNTHKDIGFLLSELNQIFFGVNFLSQRLDILDHVPGLLEAEIASDKRSFTLGIEGISRRQRMFYQKGLEELGLSRLLNKLLRSPIREIKLFYILSGHENAQDFSEFGCFLSHLKEMKQNTNPGLKILFSFGLLIRMPRTPLAFDKLFLEQKDWLPLIEGTKKVVEEAGFDFRLAFDATEYDFSQVLALGGYELHQLLQASAAAGIWYDRNLSPGAGHVLDTWLTKNQWIQKNKDEKPSDWPHPLEFISGTVSFNFLYKRYQEAKTFLNTSSLEYNPETCLGRDCLGCGSCSKDQISFLKNHLVKSPSLILRRELEQQVREKHRLRPLIFEFILPPEWQGAGQPWVESALTRVLLEDAPEVWKDLIKVEELLWLKPKGPYEGLKIQGQTLVGLFLRLGNTATQAIERWCQNGILSPWTGGFPRDISNQWEIKLPQEFFPEAPQRFSKYLTERHLPHTLIKSPGLWEWQISSKAMGKKEILKAVGHTEGGSLILNIESGPKAELRTFLDLFPASGTDFNAELKIICLKV